MDWIEHVTDIETHDDNIDLITGLRAISQAVDTELMMTTQIEYKLYNAFQRNEWNI